MSEVSDFINNYNPKTILPYLHVTIAENFISHIMQTEKLEPQFCKVFAEHLIYLFYGRPAYKIDTYNEIRTDEYLYPICFVVKPNSIADAKRIFPFDSGAFINGKYDEFLTSQKKIKKGIDRKSIIDEFSLGNNIDALPKFVSAFFEDNEKYYQGKIRTDIKLDYTNIILNKYLELIIQTGSPTSDDRKYTVEIQVDKEIGLQDNILAVILPRSACDNENIQKLLDKWKAIPIKYTTAVSRSPDSYNGVIFEKVFEFFKSINVL